MNKELQFGNDARNSILKGMKKFYGCEVVDDFGTFAEKCDIVVTNRYDTKLDVIKEKVFTRDIYKRD